VKRLLLFVFLFQTGCATYQSKLSQPLMYMQNGHADKAAELIKKEAFEPSRDQLVYLLDYSTAKQLAGDYKGSNEGFEKAGDLADLNDYHSITKVTASLLLSEEMVQYKGDDYEKVLIPIYGAINYLMLHDKEDARVKVRKLNDLANFLEIEGKKPFKNNPFAPYLSALIWEDSGNLDNAYIEYKNAYAIDAGYDPVEEDLLRVSYILGRLDDYAMWKKKFPTVKTYEKKWKDRSQGELVVIYQQGKGPRKQPAPSFPRLPELVRVGSAGVMARVVVDGKVMDKTLPVFSVEDTAMKTLGEQYAGLLAKRLGGVAAKAVVADQIRQKNQLLGDLTWIAMNVADRADVRQWVSLPQTFQVGRVVLPPGKHKVKIEALTYDGNPSGESSDEMEIEIQPMHKTFVNWRSFK
jgi:hypothetical protein